MVPTAKQLFLQAAPTRAGASPVQDEREKRFFGYIRLSNGVSKTTESHRMGDVDQAVSEVCCRIGLTPRAVLDVAVSSGVSTCEWVESLNRAGWYPEVTATDLTMYAYLVELFPGCDALVDREGFPLQFDVGGIALRPWSPRRYYLLGNYLWTSGYRALFAWLAKRCDLTARLKALNGGVPPDGDPLIKAKVPMVTEQLRHRHDIELLDDDIFAPSPPCLKGRFDVIRAANILNLAYFPRPRLQEAVRNLRIRLSGPSALLVVVRTLDAGDNHGTIFRLDDQGRFQPVERIGRGSEIEREVLDV